MLHDLGKDVMTFRHRALPRDGEVARCARILARVGIETASNSMFSFVVQYITVYRPTNVGTLVYPANSVSGRETANKYREVGMSVRQPKFLLLAAMAAATPA